MTSKLHVTNGGLTDDNQMKINDSKMCVKYYTILEAKEVGVVLKRKPNKINK